jgi:hypothetical protein
MKCTLRKVSDGIIVTIDERPRIDDHWVYIGFDEPIEVGHPVYMPNWFNKLWDKGNYHKILASTFGVGLELVAPLDDIMSISDEEWFAMLESNKEYEYTITDNKLIIKL